MMRASRLGPIASLALAALFACSEAELDSLPAAEPIAAPIAELAEPLTGPIRMVELRDGRVLLMDTRERRLMRVDFVSGVIDTISRQGDGPLEYRSMIVLATAPGDSVWGFDIVRRRMMVFGPDGEPARSFSTMVGDDPMQRLSAAWLRAVDSSGRWLGRAQRFSRVQPLISDTLVVLRTDPAQQSVDTGALLAGHAPKRNADGSYLITDFTSTDGWAALSDGTVLVVRGGDYGIELHHPAGGVDTVGAIPHRRVVLSESDAELVRDSVAKATRALVAAAMANIPDLKDGSRPPTHVLPQPLPTHWPLLVGDEPVLTDRQDRAWVRVRTAAFDSGATRFDLIGRDGRFVKAVQIPAGEELVGFGREAVYLARRDPDGLLWLRRHPIPKDKPLT
jgi:hypothetical protein